MVDGKLPLRQFFPRLRERLVTFLIFASNLELGLVCWLGQLTLVMIIAGVGFSAPRGCGILVDGFDLAVLAETV
jgi:hypothetical protein